LIDQLIIITCSSLL